jgi:hypothetical protein
MARAGRELLPPSAATVSRVTLRAELRDVCAGPLTAGAAFANGSRRRWTGWPVRRMHGVARRSLPSGPAPPRADRGPGGSRRLGAELAHARDGPGARPGSHRWRRAAAAADPRHLARHAAAHRGARARISGPQPRGSCRPFLGAARALHRQQSVRGDAKRPRRSVYGIRWGLLPPDWRQGDRIESEGRPAAARARHELTGARVREVRALAAYATPGLPSVRRRGLGAGARSRAPSRCRRASVTDLPESLRGASPTRDGSTPTEASCAPPRTRNRRGRPLPDRRRRAMNRHTGRGHRGLVLTGAAAGRRAPIRTERHGAGR